MPDQRRTHLQVDTVPSELRDASRCQIKRVDNGPAHDERCCESTMSN